MSNLMPSLMDYTQKELTQLIKPSLEQNKSTVGYIIIMSPTMTI